MAKIFQNIIKLEDRILPTVNKDTPQTNQGGVDIKLNQEPINQGRITIKNTLRPPNQGELSTKIQPPTRIEIIDQLGIVGDAIKRNASNIKVIGKTVIGVDTIPPEYKTITPLNQNSQLESKVLINFPSKISLEDRLKQSSLGTTAHLPQFFLSDVYTGYLTILPFDFKPDQGGQTPTQFNVSITQGGLNPVLFSPNIIQGGVTPTIAIQDISGEQGIVNQNGILSSYIVLSGFNPTINQGSTTIGPYNPIINQGSITLTPFNPTINQGSITITGFNPIINQGGVDVQLLVGPSIAKYQGSESTPFDTPLIENLQGTEPGAQFPKGYQFIAATQGLVPNILAYEVDRLAATVTPIIKHGSAIINKVGPPTDDESRQRAFITTPAIRDSNNNTREDLNDTGPFIQDAPSGVRKTETGYEYDVSRLSGKNKGLSYSTLGFEGIAKRGKESNQTGTSDFRDDINPNKPAPFNGPQDYRNQNIFTRLGVGDYGKTGVDRSDYTQDLGLSDILNTSEQATSKDMVKLIFESVRDNTILQFRSYISSFNESFNIDYEDITYIGRPEPLKIYTGNSREGSLSFLVAAGTRRELRVVHQKLDKLAQIIYSADYSDDGLFFAAPFTFLTVGDYYKKMPVSITSLKYDTKPGEYPWEINLEGDLFEGPQMMSVDMSFSVLGKRMPVYGRNLINTVE